MEKEKRKYIEEVIEDIMVNDGPDRHTDGSDIITDFVVSLIENNDKDWVKRYFSDPEKERLKDTFADLLNYHNE